MEKRKILIVDDDANIAELIALYLTKECFQCEIAEDGETALEKHQSFQPDLILLDIMLPGIDGYELCRRIRAKMTTPILFLSARDSELNKVVGLELGADDYLAKPFGVRELLARTRALLRRSQGLENAQPSNEVTASGITLNEDTHVAQGEKGPIDLTPREFELLSCLMHNAGKVVSREDLLHDAWGWEFITETKTVDTHIKRLRDKIEAAGYDPKLVETLRGYGYRFKK